MRCRAAESKLLGGVTRCPQAVAAKCTVGVRPGGGGSGQRGGEGAVGMRRGRGRAVRGHKKWSGLALPAGGRGGGRAAVTRPGDHEGQW
jgi:hypothetical protein